MESETLGVLIGCKQYLYGTKFEVVVDHKLLLPLYALPADQATSSGYRFSADMSDSGLGQRDAV